MPVAAIALPAPLLEGDHCTSVEFIHRWEAMPDLKHAELIDGVVFMASPIRSSHGKSSLSLSHWLALYEDDTPGVEAFAEATWIMGAKDVPQPDIALRVLPECGGQSGDDGHYVAGAPEMVVEVTGSSTSRDLGAKKLLYERVGVREYITVLLHTKQVIWRELVRGRYRDVTPDDDGLYRSRAFPGLWLDPAALWHARRSVRTAVEKGLRSPEHAAFVKRLAAKAASRKGATTRRGRRPS